MTITEATAVNTLLRFVFEIEMPMTVTPDEGDARRAAALLADGAYGRLKAGVHVGDIGKAAYRHATKED
jgi:hypothetical protein